MRDIFPHAERDQVRSSIKVLSDHKTKLEDCLFRQMKPHPDIAAKLQKLTGTADTSGQLRALTDVHNQMHKIYFDKLKELAKNDLTAFAEVINPDEPPAPHHRWFCDQLMRMERREKGFMRLCISAPPGSAKSTYSSRIYPAWYIGRNPKHKYLQGGHTQTFVANEFGSPTRNIVQSEAFRTIFPDIMVSSDKRASDAWTTTTGARYYAKGVGVGLAGFRANCAGIDDPFALRADAESALIRQRVWDWFSADFTTRLLPHSPMFVIMTRWNSDDLVGRISEMSRKKLGLPWNIINLPAVCDNIDTDPMGRELGESYWEDFYDIKTLMDLKATLPSRDWSSLYMGEPADKEGNVVDLSWFKRHTTLPLKSEIKRTLLSVDTAIKKNERADYTVAQVWFETYSGIHYLVHVKRDKLEFNEMVKAINTVAKSWNVDAILMEDKGSGTQYIQTQGNGQGPFPVIPISTDNNSKEFRMDGCTPMIEGGETSIPVAAEWLADFENEVLGFPFYKNDDHVDALSQYLNHVKKKVSGTTKTLSRGNDSQNSSKIQKSISDQVAKIVEERVKHPILEALAQQAS